MKKRLVLHQGIPSAHLVLLSSECNYERNIYELRRHIYNVFSACCVVMLIKSAQIGGRNFNGSFNTLHPPLHSRGHDGTLCKICTKARELRARVFSVVYHTKLRRVLGTYQRHFGKFSPLEERHILETAPPFFLLRSLDRALGKFISRLRRERNYPKSRRVAFARASALRRNAKSVVGAPSLLGSRHSENIRRKFNAKNRETGGIAAWKHVYILTRQFRDQEERIASLSECMFVSLRLYIAPIYSPSRQRKCTYHRYCIFARGQPVDKSGKIHIIISNAERIHRYNIDPKKSITSNPF